MAIMSDCYFFPNYSFHLALDFTLIYLLRYPTIKSPPLPDSIQPRVKSCFLKFIQIPQPKI